MARYKVHVGINWGNRRAEPGDVVELPDKMARWMTEQGLVSPDVPVVSRRTKKVED